MRFLSIILNLIIATGLYAQPFQLRLELNHDGEPVSGLKAEVWLKKEKVSELSSDENGIMKVTLETNPSLEISLVIPPSEHKRYMIYLKELDTDYSYKLDLTELSLSEQQRIDDAQEGKVKLRDDFATEFLMYDKYLNRIKVVEKEKLGNSIKLTPINVMLISGNRVNKRIGERADNVFKERERAYNKEQAELKRKEKLREEYNEKQEEKEEKKQEAKEEKQEEREEEREETEKERDKWEKRLKKYEKKVDKYKDQLRSVEKDQRKLDKKIRKGKLSPNDARDRQKSLRKQRDRIRNKLQDAEKDLKKHRKDKP